MIAKSIKTVRSIKDLRKNVTTWRGAGDNIALVPTMGALHDGHIALVRRALKAADRVVVSIFVNPAQFAAHEDLSRYPRDEAGDLAKLTTAGADLVWMPSVGVMYPGGFATHVEPAGAALGLEGDVRPHHFGGVATVVAKLFHQVTPDTAVFGEKDYQQLCVIRQLARDLDINVKIIGLPTVREKDGLARSSRNRYLSEIERRKAPALFGTLTSLAVEIADSRAKLTPAKIDGLCEAATKGLIAEGFAKVDYVAVRDAETLGAFNPKSGRPGRVLAAAWLGTTRLIDNVAVA